MRCRDSTPAGATTTTARGGRVSRATRLLGEERSARKHIARGDGGLELRGPDVVLSELAEACSFPVATAAMTFASDGQDVARFIEPKLRCVYRHQQWHTSAKTWLPTAPDERLNVRRGSSDLHRDACNSSQHSAKYGRGSTRTSCRAVWVFMRHVRLTHNTQDTCRMNSAP